MGGLHKAQSKFNINQMDKKKELQKERKKRAKEQVSKEVESKARWLGTQIGEELANVIPSPTVLYKYAADWVHGNDDKYRSLDYIRNDIVDKYCMDKKKKEFQFKLSKKFDPNKNKNNTNNLISDDLGVSFQTVENIKRPTKPQIDLTLDDDDAFMTPIKNEKRNKFQSPTSIKKEPQTPESSPSVQSRSTHSHSSFSSPFGSAPQHTTLYQHPYPYHSSPSPSPSHQMQQQMQQIQNQLGILVNKLDIVTKRLDSFSERSQKRVKLFFCIFFCEFT